MDSFTRRGLLLSGGALIGVLAQQRLQLKSPIMDGTTSLIPKPAKNTMNDASLLSQTPVNKHIILKQDPGVELIDRLRLEIREAASEDRPVNIGAARHSMGGQAIPRDGHAITFETGFLQADLDTQTYRVGAGVRWQSAIAQLDPIGFSPKVMQSNSDFGIASTFCVNAHGWPVPHSAMGSTVNSFKMLLADGDLVTCSRNENLDLFNLTMGGYGLTGLITELDVNMVPNQLLTPTFDEMPASEFGPRFMAALQDPSVSMAYGRLNVDRERFFEDALMMTYRPSSSTDEIPPVTGSGFVSKFAAKLFREQLNDERMKRTRWWIETDLARKVAAGDASRNSLMNEPVVTLDDGDPHRTDILHEYFIEPERFAEFAQVCKRVIPASYQEMLNITLRYVAPDYESVLAYAPVPRIACVMLFSQEMTLRAEEDHKRMTQDLIDGVLAINGTYYLPYRPHARVDQFAMAYPRAEEFVERKRKIDPRLRFRNNLWDSYLSKI